jgi:poly [ADP-ribose] polymerase
MLKGGAVHSEYACMLNQVNLEAGANNNKFYKLQLINVGGTYYQWVRYGRVGESGATQQKGPFAEDEGVKTFTAQFKSKTSNNWDTRLSNFVKKKGKYDLVATSNINSTSDVAAKAAAIAAAAGGGAKVVVAPCSLDATTQDLMGLIFDEKVFAGAMASMNIDPAKLPLGALSRAQIDRGYAALKELIPAVQSGNQSKIAEATAKFYTIIPHAFGRSKPPLIATKEEADKKVEMLNTLAQIEDAMSMRTRASGRKGKGKTTTIPHPADNNYAELNADLTHLKKGSKELKIIETYLANTSTSSAGFCSWGGGGAMKLEDVWACDRHGEADTFAKYNKLENRKLLWHGTNVAVVAAILKSGLRIMPHSGGRVGAGIYLADQHAKSAGYCQQATAPDGRKSIIMFLVEGALGKEHQILTDDWTLKKPPAGFNSVVARGNVEPDPFKDATMMLDGKKVKVPQTKEQQTGRNSRFHHNEFLVYDEGQHRIRFVLRFTR